MVLENNPHFQSYAEANPVFLPKLKGKDFTDIRDAIDTEKINFNLLNLKASIKSNPSDITREVKGKCKFHKLDALKVAKRAFILASEISRAWNEEGPITLVTTRGKRGTIMPNCHMVRTKTTKKRLMYGLMVIIDNFKSNNITYMREFLYNGRSAKLFGENDTVAANSTVHNIAIQLHVDERFLSIVPESHGLICCLGTLSLTGGPLSSKEGLQKNCNGDNVLIPSGGVCEIKFTNPPPRCVVITEHKGPFHNLVQFGIHKKLNCVLVCSSGQPDLATRKVVKYLKKTHNIPVFGIFDCDIHGSAIMKTFCFGAQETICFSSHLMLNEIYWVGLKPSDFSLPNEIVNENDNILKRINLVQPSHINVSLAKKFVNQQFVTSNVLWKNELELLQIGSMSISSLSQLHTKYLGVWLLKKLEEEQWIEIKYHEEEQEIDQPN